MELGSVALVAGFVLAYSMVSKRIETTWITGPMIFVSAGVLMGPAATDVLDIGMSEGVVRGFAEATLVLVLYTDAIRIDLRRLRSQFQLPARLLGVGLPLTVVAGALVGWWLLPEFGFWEAALLAAVLTPTDAALGQAVVANPNVPGRIRQALNVESGLNDGLMLPLITALLAVVAAEMDLETPGYWISFVAAQIGFGVLVGAASGWAGGRLIDRFVRTGWVDGAFRQLATLAVGVLGFAAAEVAGGNGFVAAFVAGLAFGAAARTQCEGAYDFAEDEGQLLTLLTFLFFGAAMAGPALTELTWAIAGYAVASLTIVRMVPVGVAVLGLGLSWPTVGFLGWFGPRGLASILFGLFVLEEAAIPRFDELLLVVTWTVLSSIVVHGASSVPLSGRYGRWAGSPDRTDMAERIEVEMMPSRGGRQRG